LVKDCGSRDRKRTRKEAASFHWIVTKACMPEAVQNKQEARQRLNQTRLGAGGRRLHEAQRQ